MPKLNPLLLLGVGLGAMLLFRKTSTEPLPEESSPGGGGLPTKPPKTSSTRDWVHKGVKRGPDGYPIATTLRNAEALVHARMAFETAVTQGVEQSAAQDIAIKAFKEATGSENDQLAFATIRSWRSNEMSDILAKEGKAMSAAVIAFEKALPKKGIQGAQDAALLAYQKAGGTNPHFIKHITEWTTQAVSGVVGFIVANDRLRYFHEHHAYFMGLFPPKDNLNRRDREHVPQMQNHFVMLLRNGHPSRKAANMTISKYFAFRGAGRTDVANAFKEWGTIDDRIKQEQAS